MYEALNMGVGMCVVLPKSDAGEAISISKEWKCEAQAIGYARKDSKSRVYIPPKNIVYEKVIS